MRKKRILLLSFYFRPDLCAGSFRATALIDALLEKIDGDTSIDVLTTMPNRYSSYASDAPSVEHFSNLRIHRISLPGHKSGMLDQSVAFQAYARKVVELAGREEYSVVVATSSRLMTAALGSAIARWKKAPLYLDIRDIFVDTLGDVMPGRASLVLQPFFAMVERFTLRRAARLNLVSEGFRRYFAERYPAVACSFFTNGIDEEFLSAGQVSDEDRSHDSGEVPLVLYAGNMGEGQGLHEIVPELARRLEGRARFRIIGDGGRRQQLEAALSGRGCRNVELAPPVSRDRLLEEYRRADVLFLHLNDYPSFEKVLPSKLFEYGAFGKPVLAGVAGYAAEFVAREMKNAEVFRPCDADGGVDAFGRLSMETRPDEAFIARFRRRSIMARMADDILSLTASGRSGR